MSIQTIWPYQTLGDEHRPALLFLHGFMGSGLDWLPLAERCADRFYCVLPDLPGHGRNIGLPLTAPLNFEGVVAALHTFIGQLGLAERGVNLVGYSMGGRLALYAALTTPHRINRLVLEGANPGIQEEAARQARAKLDDQRAASLLQAGLDAFVESWYQMGLFASLRQQPEQLKQTRLRRKQNNPQWMAKVIRELSPGRQPPLWSRLGSLAMPCLLLAGALDAKYVDLAQRMGAMIPQATVELVPAAGHNVHLEQPERFVELVRGFVGGGS